MRSNCRIRGQHEKQKCVSGQAWQAIFLIVLIQDRVNICKPAKDLQLFIFAQFYIYKDNSMI